MDKYSYKEIYKPSLSLSKFISDLKN